MKYLTTLEVANQLAVSKQTLLNWLYSSKVPEPPRDRKGYRLWSPTRVSLIKKQIGEGRLHRRTILHRQPGPEVLSEYAREVAQFLREAGIPASEFLREMAGLDAAFRRAIRLRPRRARRRR